MRRLVVALTFAAGVVVSAQDTPTVETVRRWRQQHERGILTDMVGLASLPNITGDIAALARNADAISEHLQRRGIAVTRVGPPGAAPVVVGTWLTPGATRTIALYAHYDGQPLDPQEWSTPPFEPVLRDGRVEDGGRVVAFPQEGARINPEWRLYGRSTADDKAPIVAMLAAVDAITASGLRRTANIKLIFEGEEEASSVNLQRTIAGNRALFAADVWLICDGPIYPTRQQSVLYGSRGTLVFDVTVYGPRVELHSGHYGNWAPNPALALSRLLTSMKGVSGRVDVAGFYDQVEPLGPVERAAIARAPVIDQDLMRQLWLGSTDGAPQTLNDLITQPSLNIRGMSSARTGSQASNVIPASATASMDIRLVKGMELERTAELVRAHIRRQGFFVVDKEPAGDIRRAHPQVALVSFRPGVIATRTKMDLPISLEVASVVEAARGDIVRLPTMGGQVPLNEIERALGVTTIVIPMGNHDNNQHSFDENLRIQNLWDGIEVMAALMTM
jgi:acetylornithine deacetylase/succinyl-diaminopimelate desuccinylase-like protein